MIDEALAYFKEKHAFDELFTLFKKKYESLGRVGGTVRVEKFREVDLEAIARFFGLAAIELKQQQTVSLIQFEKQLNQTRFAPLELKELLEAYFDEKLISNKRKKELQMADLDQYFLQLEHDFPRLTPWLQYVRKKTPDSFWIHRLIEDSQEKFTEKMQYLHQALLFLPTKRERLPLFSQRITRDPHAFDLDTDTGILWIHLLAVTEAEGDSVTIPNDTESINDLLLRYNILRDDITNYVTVANFYAEMNGEAHPLWEAAVDTNSTMNVPLRELIRLTTAYPATGKKDVWIVENSSVFSSMIDELPQLPLVCTHGQFKLAALLFIDLLVEEGCTIYYASDIDPEGLGMAERLFRRHPDHVQVWKMDVAAYETSQSLVELSEERLKKLAAIEAEPLLPLVALLKEKKYPGYQEALVEEMVAELREYQNELVPCPSKNE